MTEGSTHAHSVPIRNGFLCFLPDLYLHATLRKPLRMWVLMPLTLLWFSLSWRADEMNRLYLQSIILKQGTPRLCDLSKFAIKEHLWSIHTYPALHFLIQKVLLVYYVFIQKTQEKPVCLSRPRERGQVGHHHWLTICALRKVLEGIRTSSCFGIFALLVWKVFGRGGHPLCCWRSLPGEQTQLWGPSPFRSLRKLTFRQKRRGSVVVSGKHLSRLQYNISTHLPK